METNGDGKSKLKNVKSEKINVKLNKSVINDKVDKVESKKVKNKDNSVTFIIVEKNGSLKDNDIKESLICAEELSKKCKFKKVDGFIKRTQWSCYSSKNEKENVSGKIIVELWAKDDGIANSENKYEFPPPVDTELFFGACALVARDSKNNYINLTKDKWNKIYEYLFGGFESLLANDDDDDEEDELESISKNKKTRDGYLKDGFVVDGVAIGDSDVDVAGNSDSDSDEDDDDDDSETDSDKSSENGGDGDGDGDGGGGTEGVYFKKNKNILIKNVSTKIKIKNKNSMSENEKHILKEEEDDNSGWKTDESSELSEEEYSYSK